MSDVLDKIISMAEPLLAGTDMFIVRAKIKPTNNIKLYVDADTGLSVNKSADLNRKLYKQIEASAIFPDGDFSLEVSSPGIDEPLESSRQYKKNIGRKVQVTLADETEKLGVLKEISEEVLVLEVKIGKKKETQIVEIPVSEIKKTVVQVSF